MIKTTNLQKILTLTLILLCFWIVWEDEKNDKEKAKGSFTNLAKALQNPMDARALYLNGNELKTLPKEIGNLQNLKVLDSGLNELTTLPKEIGELQNLRYLNLSDNQLMTLPKEIWNSKKLRVLY
ncbi:leucine-rich repeat domain-containing protein [Leptospira borgpetersenii]|uniref:Leucine rich repeat protein n=1 Tax=Leptospira borgpetersenii str. Brem 328 TaxID=1049780 RepID=A0ABC9SKC1_LEPBO|nr:leucine rich repeat protein [Leptospira borgpetersenii str. Brem 307]EMN18130.1 leucine rich repeat protein [Leptospira borgpetersenii str. Brem 328]